MNRVLKILLSVPISGGVGKAFNLLNFDKFMHYSTWYYRKLGIHVADHVTYICPGVYFDSADFSAITIEKGVTISREVLFLTHDYSMHTPMINVGWKPKRGEVAHYIKPIHVGEDSFIGARVTLLGGTTIGKNCIIGANSCVKGNIPDDSIVIGNPAKIVGNTKEWAKHKLVLRDWIL